MHIYDYIIIGSGLTGLQIATKISQETKNVLLLEAEPFFGGANRPATIRHHVFENGLRFWPGTELAHKNLSNLEDLLGLKLIRAEQENHPLTYDASGFKDFVGFGDRSPEFYDQLAYFLSPKEIVPTLPVHQIVTLLKEKFQGEYLPRSYVTKFNFTEDQLTHLTVNGAKAYYAKNFIFAGSVRDLNVLLPDEILNPRAKAKLKKDTYWMSLCLDLYHEELTTDHHNLYVLNGTTDDDIGPCLGRFLPETQTEKGLPAQISQWMSFIDLDTSEETENIGEVLKKMKRQIKRAFPELTAAVKIERIYMSSPLSAGELKLNARGTLPKVDNLWIASAAMNATPNLVGSLLQAQLTLASLGFGDSATQHFIEDESSNSEDSDKIADL